MSSGPLAVLAAGGTGGHMFPAEALARELIARGWRVALASDSRGERYASTFPAETHLALEAATGSGPLGLTKAGLKIAKGVVQAQSAFGRMKPAVVVGFGGYPSLPALMAAITRGLPTVLHEQNAVLGRANRALAAHVKTVACAFPTLQRAPAAVAARKVVVGNPVRPDIAALYDKPFAPPTGKIEILITGGSQGARLLSQTLPLALAALPEDLRVRLRVAQQTRPENMDEARAVYADALIEAEVAPFFRDMASRLGRAHLVVGRAGASTCSELAVAGRPSILIPLKIAADDHQRLNAKLLTDAGAAEVVLEDELTVERMASAVMNALTDPMTLGLRASAARSVAEPAAASKLADLVIEVAG